MNDTDHNKKLRLLFHIYEFKTFVIILSLFLVISIILIIASYNSNYSISEENGVRIINNVTMINQQAIETPLSIPKSVAASQPIFYKILIPHHNNNTGIMSIATTFSYCNVNVYVDGNLIYKIKNSGHSLLKSGGYQSVLFDLPENIQTPYVSFMIEPLLNIKNYKISEIKYGRKSDIIINELSEDLLTIIVSFFLLVNFIISMIINAKRISFAQGEHFSVFHLSVFGLLIGIYFLTQLWSISYFLGSIKEAIYMLEYMSLLLLFVPFAQFLKHKVDPRFIKYHNCFIGIIILNTLIQLTLSITKVLEFKEMISVSHIIIILYILLVILSIIFTDRKKYPIKIRLLIPLIAIMISAIIPVIYYIFFKIVIFKNLALLIATSFIVIELTEIYDKYADYQKDIIKNEIYKKMAVTDSLTGIGNRKAYDDMILKIESEKISGWIAVIDINNLKYVNDNYGHTTGDILIKKLAAVLKEIKKTHPHIFPFRTGGDEFCVFIKESNTYNIEELIKQIKSKYKNIKESDHHFIPSISAGYQFYNPTICKNPHEIYNQADKMMYQEKAKYKKQMSIH